MTTFPIDIPERHRKRLRGMIGQSEFFRAFNDFWLRRFRLDRKSTQVAFHVREKNGDAECAEILREHGERDRLPSPGGAGDEPMTIGHARMKENGAIGLSDEE